MSDAADVFPWLELTPWDWACALAVMAAGAVLLRGLFALTEVPDLWGGRPAPPRPDPRRALDHWLARPRRRTRADDLLDAYLRRRRP